MVPEENAEEAAIISGVEVIPVRNLMEAEQYLNDSIAIEPAYVDAEALLNQNEWGNAGGFF